MPTDQKIVYNTCSPNNVYTIGLNHSYETQNYLDYFNFLIFYFLLGGGGVCLRKTPKKNTLYMHVSPFNTETNV